MTDNLKAAEFNCNLTEHRDKLIRHLTSMTAYKGDVEDIIQRATLTMWNKYDTFKQGTSFYNWACQIVKFELYNFARKHRRGLVTFDEQVYETAVENLTNPEVSNHEALLALEKVVLELPKDLAKLLQAVYSEGHSIKTVAERDGKCPTTYYNKLSLLRKKLMLAINKQPND